MSTETQNIALPLDQPYRALNVLRSTMQQLRDQSSSLLPALPVPRDGQRVVIVDSDTGRVQHISQLIVAAGYQPLIANNVLTAFTRYLQRSFLPLAIMLVEDNGNDALVLLRFQQHVQQKYHWNFPIMRLQTQPTSRTGPLQTFRPSDSLGETTSARRPSKTGTLPLQITPLSFVQTAQVQRAVSPISTIPTSPIPAMNNAPAHLRAAHSEPDTIIEIRNIKKESLEGQNLGRYQIMNRLGGTLLADVYRAYDRLRETDVALKSIQRSVLPDEFLSDAYVNTNFFQQEVNMLAELKHPHIFRIMNAGKSYISGTPFYYKTMPLCKVGSLAAWRFEHGNTRPLTWQEVLPIALQLADALQYVHDRKLMYQNFKLTNILLEGQVRDDMRHLHVSLADFMLTGDNEHPLYTPDSLPYLAPEQWNGKAFPASDQYGLAAILYELLTGRPPFQGNQEHLLRHMHCTMQPQSPRTFNATISPTIDMLLLRALAKNPHDRFATIAIFARRLREGA
jgi:hypothetical protein